MRKFKEYATVVVATLVVCYAAIEFHSWLLEREAEEDWKSCGIFIHKFQVIGKDTAAFEVVDTKDTSHGKWRQHFLLKDLKYCVVKKTPYVKKTRHGYIVKFYTPVQNVSPPVDRYFIDETTFEEIEYFNRERNIVSTECSENNQPSKLKLTKNQ